jgi:hypothetical protein
MQVSDRIELVKSDVRFRLDEKLKSLPIPGGSEHLETGNVPNANTSTES